MGRRTGSETRTRHPVSTWPTVKLGWPETGRAMFRMLRLKPPNGWNAVAWELGIVTLGVLIALGAQQWADDLSWRSKARAAIEAVRDEVRNHYRYSVEWRVVEPCLYAQIDRLSERLVASGDRNDPAPVYSEPGFDFYVLRMPNRAYDRGVWDAAIGDGVTTYFDRDVRNALNRSYTRIDQLNDGTSLNNAAYPHLFGLSRPLPMDTGSRLTFLRTLDELRGRVEYMSLLSGQVIGRIEAARLTPDKREIARLAADGGTARFCRLKGYPLRDVNAAMEPIAE